MEAMRILVVGAGAVGGYFGGRLAQAKRDVTFLVRAQRAAQIRAKGLQIVSPGGDWTVHPKAVTAKEITQPYDLILLAVKSYALEGAMNDFAPAVGAETIILPLLNGMRHIDVLSARFGKHAVMGGVCLVATEVDAEGRIRQLADFQSIVYGELDGKTTARLERLSKAIQGAGFDAAASTDILQAMWEKWVQIASVGGINCLLGGSIGDVVAAPGGIDIALSVLKECAEVATACGHPPAADFLEQQKAYLTAQGSRLTTSMYRDLKKNAPVEADAILGDLLERGQKHKLSVPLLQAAFVNLSIYESRRDRERTKAS